MPASRRAREQAGRRRFVVYLHGKCDFIPGRRPAVRLSLLIGVMSREAAMTVAAKVDRFLSRQGVGYDIIFHSQTRSLRQAAEAAHIPPRQFARALIVETDLRRHMVVLPLDHLLDFQALERCLGARPRLVPVHELESVFDDCESGCIPPLAQSYGFDAVCDAALFAHPRIVFEGGVHNSLLRVDASGFNRLMREATRAVISRPDESLSESAGRTGTGTGRPPVAPAAMDALKPERELAARIEEIYELPLMPGHARELLMLRNRPEAHVSELARVVEQDPSLAAQVMKYARSPLFGYAGRIDSIEEAISRVLGFDMVLNLALGLAALKPFRIAPDGPLGLTEFWRHAALSAGLAQRLAQEISPHQRPVPGLLYLAGLLHNFGYLVLGQLFQPEFYLLNRMVAANPDTPVTVLEQRVLCRGQAREVMCAGHAQVGAWLMQRWDLPAPVVTAVRHHHQPEFEGEHASYSQLVLCADRLLKRYGLGDGDSGELPTAVLERLGLDAEAVSEIAAQYMEQCGSWNAGLEQGVA